METPVDMQDKAAFIQAGMERVRAAIAVRVLHDVASFEDIERAIEAAFRHLIGADAVAAADAAPAEPSADPAPPSPVPETAGAAAPAEPPASSPAPDAPSEGDGG